MTVQRDPDYEFVPPLPERAGNLWPLPKGRQCGECGMKFEYGKAYGYCCASTKCPMGWTTLSAGR